jgi:hypothetical protein
MKALTTRQVTKASSSSRDNLLKAISSRRGSRQPRVCGRKREIRERRTYDSLSTRPCDTLQSSVNSDSCAQDGGSQLELEVRRNGREVSSEGDTPLLEGAVHAEAVVFGLE